MIHFVGAGPGAPDLIPLRGAELLTQAEVCIYAGSLVNPVLLGLCREDCAIYNSAEMTLDEVLAVMEQAEAKGKQTVRLHTGDPCLYGAIREQMDALDAKGIPYAITPGVSSFCGAAAAAEAEPEMAPNKALAPAFVTSSAPGSLPKMAMTKFTSRLAMPPWFIRLPARMKKGIAVRLNLLMPTKMRWAPVTTEMSRGTVCRIVTREAMPME